MVPGVLDFYCDRVQVVTIVTLLHRVAQLREQRISSRHVSGEVDTFISKAILSTSVDMPVRALGACPVKHADAAHTRCSVVQRGCR
jgi:hypothetical protein